MTQPIHPVLERVARAMCDGNWDAASVLETPSGETPDEFRDYWRDKARAAIQALLEPDEGMVEAAYEITVHGADLHDFAVFDCARPVFQAMLKPLLGDEPQPVPGVYGPEQHAAGFVAKEVG